MTDWKFEKKTYNGIEIIVETNSGYVNASQMCSSNGKLWRQYKTTNQWKEIVEIFDEFIKPNEISKEIQGVDFPTPQFDIKITRDFQGTYVHPKLVHFVAEYVSKRYAFKVAELMDSINNQVHQQLIKKNQPDIPTNAQPIFEQTIEQHRFVSDNENSQCWGVREHDKFDYLSSWDKDNAKHLWLNFKQALKTKLDLTFDELARDYPQLLD